MSPEQDAYMRHYAQVYENAPSKAELHTAISKSIPKAIHKGQTWLDIGCGPGTFAGSARRKGYKYFGTDINPYILERAKKERSFGKYTLADCREQVFAPESVDVITLNMVLQSLPTWQDMWETFAISWQQLKPTGILCYSMLHPKYTRAIAQYCNPNANYGMLSEAAPFKMERQYSRGSISFHGHHYSLGTIYNGLIRSGYLMGSANELEDVGATDHYLSSIPRETRYEAEKRFLQLCGIANAEPDLTEEEAQELTPRYVVRYHTGSVYKHDHGSIASRPDKRRF